MIFQVVFFVQYELNRIKLNKNNLNKYITKYIIMYLNKKDLIRIELVDLCHPLPVH